jgi:hypothetical protein
VNIGWLIGGLLLCTQFLIGSDFTEKRYIYALDKTTVYKGSITLSEESTVVRYLSPEKKVLTQVGNILTIEEGETNKKQIVDLSKRIDMNLYFSFMRSIHKKEFSALKNYFEITKENNTFHLLPKSDVKRAIEKMEIALRGDEMKKMVIHFTNGDVIEIEAL